MRRALPLGRQANRALREVRDPDLSPCLFQRRHTILRALEEPQCQPLCVKVRPNQSQNSHKTAKTTVDLSKINAKSHLGRRFSVRHVLSQLSRVLFPHLHRQPQQKPKMSDTSIDIKFGCLVLCMRRSVSEASAKGAYSRGSKERNASCAHLLMVFAGLGRLLERRRRD